MQCTAKSKRTGERCKAQAVTGKDKCYHHGGATPVKHGLYSKYSRHRLADVIQQLATDPELLDLRQQIGLKQALILDKLEQLQDRLRGEDAEMLAGLSEKVSRDIERLNKIEHGEKYILQVEEVQSLINQVVVIIRQEVQDAATVKRLAERLQGARW